MSPSDTTALLRSARAGDARAADLLFPHVYAELRSLAAHHMRGERDDHTLNATALVHEAYLRLAATDGDWQDRVHFFALASRAMRRILVDYARGHRADKRGRGHRPVSLSGADADRLLAESAEHTGEAVLALDAALDGLAGNDADLARLVELRFFGGLEVDEAASLLGVSPRTAARMWARARAHLRHSLATA